MVYVLHDMHGCLDSDVYTILLGNPEEIILRELRRRRGERLLGAGLQSDVDLHTNEHSSLLYYLHGTQMVLLGEVLTFLT